MSATTAKNATRMLAGLLVFARLAASQTAGALEGKVLNTATGRPVAGAAVVLQGLDPTGNPPQPDSYVLETDASGGFRVDEIAAGRYQGSAERDGFTAQPRGATLGARRASQFTAQFTVEPGQRVKGVILKLIPLGAIAGSAVDTDGDPISHAAVVAMGYSYANGAKELKELARGFSNDRGEFRIVNVPPGRYYLMLSGGGSQFTHSTMSNLRVLGPKLSYAFADTYYPAAVDVASAVSLDLPPGGELRDRTITMSPNQTYTIQVTIAGPVADSVPMIMLFTPTGLGLGRTAEYGVAMQFPNSPPGTYMAGGEDNNRQLSAWQTVQVVNSDVDVILTLRPEIVLAGTVSVEGGEAIAVEGVRVTLEPDGPWNRVEAPVGPDGTFSLRNMRPANYHLRVKVPVGGYLKSVRLGERNLARPEIDMARPSGTLAITVGTDGGKLDGEAAEGVSVVAVPVGLPGDWPERVRSAVAGKDGKFELRDLAPGDYRVFAFEDAEPGAPQDPDFRQPFEKQSTALRVAANGHETLQLKVISAADATSTSIRGFANK